MSIAEKTASAFDVFKLRDDMVADYSNYLSSVLNIKDQRVWKKVEGILNDGQLWPDPLDQMPPNFAPGESIESLVQPAYLHLYGLNHDDTAYILDTVPIVRRKDAKAHLHCRTKDTILRICDQLQHAIATGTLYVSPLDPPSCDPRAAHPGVQEALLS